MRGLGLWRKKRSMDWRGVELSASRSNYYRRSERDYGDVDPDVEDLRERESGQGEGTARSWRFFYQRGDIHVFF